MFNPWPNSYIRTFTGRKFDFSAPVGELPFHLCDQAHALSNVARYGGHARFHYSVGLHELLGLAMMRADDVPEPVCAAFFVHDNSEAYIGDMVRPFKYTPDMAKFREYEDVLESFLFTHYVPDFDDAWLKTIKHYDNLILRYEMAQLLVDSSESQNPDYCVGSRVTIPRFAPEETEYLYLDEAIALRNAGTLRIADNEFGDVKKRMWELHEKVQPIWEAMETPQKEFELWGV